MCNARENRGSKRWDGAERERGREWGAFRRIGEDTGGDDATRVREEEGTGEGTEEIGNVVRKDNERLYVQGNFSTVTFPTLITVNHWEQTLHTAFSVNRIIKLSSMDGRGRGGRGGG